MNNVEKIKIVHEWVEKYGNVPIPPFMLDDYNGVQGQKDNAFSPKAKFETINSSTPTGLSLTIPPEILNYTKEDMQDEINCMDNEVNTFQSEDFENMQEFEGDLIKNNKTSINETF